MLDELAESAAADEAASDQAAAFLFRRAVLLGELGRTPDALSAFSEMIARFGNSESAIIQGAVATARECLVQLREHQPH